MKKMLLAGSSVLCSVGLVVVVLSLASSVVLAQTESTTGTCDEKLKKCYSYCNQGYSCPVTPACGCS